MKFILVGISLLAPTLLAGLPETIMEETGVQEAFKNLETIDWNKSEEILPGLKKLNDGMKIINSAIEQTLVKASKDKDLTEEIVNDLINGLYNYDLKVIEAWRRMLRRELADKRIAVKAITTFLERVKADCPGTIGKVLQVEPFKTLFGIFSAEVQGSKETMIRETCKELREEEIVSSFSVSEMIYDITVFVVDELLPTVLKEKPKVDQLAHKIKHDLPAKGTVFGENFPEPDENLDLIAILDPSIVREKSKAASSGTGRLNPKNNSAANTGQNVSKPPKLDQDPLITKSAQSPDKPKSNSAALSSHSFRDPWTYVLIIGSLLLIQTF